MTVKSIDIFTPNPLTQTDFYKVDHRRQYPKGTTLIYSNLTPRSDKLSVCHQSSLYDGKMVVFGIQYFVRYLHELFHANFFNKPKSLVIDKYKTRIEKALGVNAITYEHIEALHSLGYLPIQIKALPEGNRVKMRVPILTIRNTVPAFFWVTNFLESLLSAKIWKLCTNATIAFEYKKLFYFYAQKTGGSLDFINFQGHDFSFRGMSGMSGNEDAGASGMAHLTSFQGTDTIPAIDMIEHYYPPMDESELIGASVPATEHSVMCLNTKETEIDTFKRLITEVYPSGIVAIVSDTWDFWKVLNEYLVNLKPLILARKGKVVIRPDSGDPVNIICGTSTSKGAIEILWSIFGGTINEKGYKVLDSHIGLIYGDSITLARAESILQKLESQGFASSNVILGIGSYTYQYSTRDSFGMAVKSTYGEVNGEPREIFKNPVTDNGIKKSAKGLLRIDFVGGEYKLEDQVTKSEEEKGELEVIYNNGDICVTEDIGTIRMRLQHHLFRI